VCDSFKLGDFGLVAFVDHQRAPEFTPTPGRLWPVLSQESCASQEEGDRKYLAPELLNDKSNLPAADVFALGISAYELASGRELPGGGETWQRLRQGLLDPIPDFPPELFNIIRAMMAPDASLRPAASDVVCALRSLL
jgi:serine/threonine protein kinase